LLLNSIVITLFMSKYAQIYHIVISWCSNAEIFFLKGEDLENNMAGWAN
jgi:hypothetical protein